jgi:hypothetical protein
VTFRTYGDPRLMRGTTKALPGDAPASAPNARLEFRYSEVSVTRKSSWRDPLRNWLAEHFELILTSAGVAMAIAVCFMQLDQGQQGMALVFIIWLEGFIIWAVRRHSILYRRALIRKMRVMLQDRVNNQLTVMLGVAEARSRDMSPDEREDLESAVLAARSVSQELENLSIDSIRSWEHRYGRYMPRALR